MRVRKAIQDRRALRGLKVRRGKRATKAKKAIPEGMPLPSQPRRKNDERKKSAGVNQRGEAVYTFTPIAILARRPDAAS